jgi:hypothetical protein
MCKPWRQNDFSRLQEVFQPGKMPLYRLGLQYTISSNVRKIWHCTAALIML